MSTTRTQIVRCVISALNASGVPDFCACRVLVTQDQYDNGDHYDAAKTAAEEAGYESIGLIYDENDGPEWLFEHFNWSKAPLLDVPDNEEMFDLDECLELGDEEADDDAD